jgi:hypothetical protein
MYNVMDEIEGRIAFETHVLELCLKLGVSIDPQVLLTYCFGSLENRMLCYTECLNGGVCDCETR